MGLTNGMRKRDVRKLGRKGTILAAVLVAINLLCQLVNLGSSTLTLFLTTALLHVVFIMDQDTLDHSDSTNQENFSFRSIASTLVDGVYVAALCVLTLLSFIMNCFDEQGLTHFCFAILICPLELLFILMAIFTSIVGTSSDDELDRQKKAADSSHAKGKSSVRK